MGRACFVIYIYTGHGLLRAGLKMMASDLPSSGSWYQHGAPNQPVQLTTCAKKQFLFASICMCGL